MSQWRPLDPALTSGTLGGRSADIYQAVLRQFDLTHAERYAPADELTWCGTYVWDVTRAMAAEIPHWWFGKELNANGMFEWLEASGKRYGWESCSASGAVEYANEGRPAVAAWRNPKGPGHIAMVMPGDAKKAPLIAQAGRSNFIGLAVGKGFGDNQPSYFRHK